MNKVSNAAAPEKKHEEEEKGEDIAEKKVKLEFKTRELKDESNVFVNQLSHSEEEQEQKCMEIMLHSYQYCFKGETYSSALPYWGEKEVLLG